MNVLMGKKITFFTLDNKIKCRKKGDNKRSTTIWNAFTHEQFIFFQTHQDPKVRHFIMISKMLGLNSYYVSSNFRRTIWNWLEP